jgi:tight adherence protein C
MIWFVIIFVILLLGGAGVLVYVGLRQTDQDEDELQARLAEFTQRGDAIELEEIELAQPFSQRVIYPLARQLGEFAIKFTPQNALQSTVRKLELAGNPPGLEPTMFLSLRLIAGFGLGALLFIVFSVMPQKWPLGRMVLILFLAVALGLFLPELWIRGKINRRQKEIRHSMPDALDLLTICVEAGLGFDAAMSKVSEKWENELSLAFARVIREIQLGKLRRDALRDMATRVGIPEMTSFVAAVIQSEQLGVSMAKVLRIQSDQMRVRRRQLAEEEAHKAPIKMLIPMALLIFPTLMILLLAPAGFILWKSAFLF